MMSLSSAGTPLSLTTHPVTPPTTASTKISQWQTTEIKKWRTGACPFMKCPGFFLEIILAMLPILTFFLFWIRIRALYAQILEKDAVIKILNQRLHQDQGRKDEQSPHTNLLNKAASSLRPATSTPSISSPRTTTTKTRGEALGHHLLN